ncbi:hypothetical protein [Acidovorax carolinensis]|uniref:hypothetical protein n=1 Tax=Acidovorax carolinensis TaxID=553814 RepID=UPI0012FFB45A|nr:hypothetical protein [Acidovorax carolinensis]
MPAAYRFAANAPRIAASVIFMNPYVRTAVGIAAWLGVAKVFWDAADGVWKKDTDELISNYEYSVAGHLPSSWRSTPQGACQFALDSQYASYPNNVYQIASVTATMCHIQQLYNGKVVDDSYNTITKRDKPCPAGSTWTPAGCLVKGIPQPVPIEEFQTRLPSTPMPETVPWELPRPTPLPVEQPVINPEPGSNPVPRPLFVPTGDPVSNPQYDPNAAPAPNNQPYIQPGVRVNPSPTPQEPWRVDLQPVNRPVSGPEPMPEPDSETPINPDKPSEEQLDFCAKNPDVLACAKPELDTPDGEIPKSNKNIQLNEENLFGSGSCPADVYFTPHGIQQLKVWDWNQSCGYITGYVKPILIICCTFAAFMILIPGRTE